MITYIKKNCNSENLNVHRVITDTVKCVGQHLANMIAICMLDIMNLAVKAGFANRVMINTKNCMDGSAEISNKVYSPFSMVLFNTFII